MDNPYTDKDFVHEVWEEFPQLAEWHNLDNDILTNLEIRSIY